MLLKAQRGRACRRWATELRATCPGGRAPRSRPRASCRASARARRSGSAWPWASSVSECLGGARRSIPCSYDAAGRARAEGGGRRRCIMRMRARWGHVTVFARVSEPPLGAPLSPGAPALAVGACVVVCGGAPLIAHPFAPRRAGRRRRVEDVPPLMEVPAGQPERQVGQGEAVGDLPGQEISHRRLMLRRRCPFGADTGRHAALGGA